MFVVAQPGTAAAGLAGQHERGPIERADTGERDAAVSPRTRRRAAVPTPRGGELESSRGKIVVVIGWSRRGEEAAVIRSIGEVRRERLQTIRILAERAGVSTRTVLRIEHGVQTPQLGTITKLAAALGVEPREVREFRAAMGLPLEGNERA